MDFLIVENDKTSREAIGFLLAEEGYGVETTPWAEPLWTKLREKTFDAILIDLDSSPGGFDTLRDVQRAQPNAAVVLLVVEIRINITVDAVRMGILEILEKPFRRESLCLVVGRLQKQLEMSQRIDELEQKAAKEPRRIVIALVPDNHGIPDMPQRAKQPGATQAK